MEDNIILSNLIFPDVTKTIKDLEEEYKLREVEGEVVRSAPSPTGFLHTGSLFASLITYMIAKQTNGIYYIRIEDTDKKREVEGSREKFLKQLKTFKLIADEYTNEEGKDIGSYGPYIQSKRKEIYHICAKELVQKGLAYPCFCTPEMLEITRSTQEKNKQRTGYYSSYARCRSLEIKDAIQRIKNGDKYILRLRSKGSHLNKVVLDDKIRGRIEMAQNDQDTVIIKSDGLPTYHFAHAVDDHFMRTTLVTRGEEWLASYPLHKELFEALSFKEVSYAHIPVIMIKDGNSKRKLSKRKDLEADVEYFLKSGYEVDTVLEYLFTIINSNFESWKLNNDNIFDFEIKLNKMSTSGALFDIDKLNNISKENIAKMKSDNLLDRLIKWSKVYDEKIYNLFSKDLEYSKNILAIERDSVIKVRKDIVKYSDVYNYYSYFFSDEFKQDKEKENNLLNIINEKLTKDVVNKVLENYKKAYKQNNTKEEWFNNMKEVALSLGFCTDMKEYKLNKDNYVGSIADFSSIIRVALTNKTNSPDIYSIMQVIGYDETITRLSQII